MPSHPAVELVETALREAGDCHSSSAHAHTVFPLSFDELVRITGGEVRAVTA
jgi:hypothetical protein